MIFWFGFVTGLAVTLILLLAAAAFIGLRARDFSHRHCGPIKPPAGAAANPPIFTRSEKG